MDAPPPSPLSAEAVREKRWVAMTSVVAAVALAVLKIVVGLLTGSLGILSEAAHSALDLVAAVVTFVAVRVSGRPADPEHSYGHGKIENLSALLETFLLLATCAWIVYEAVSRLFVESVEIDPSVWAFAVMILSVVVNVSRARSLSRVAKKYDSQALEADALHFRTDIWSSYVVIGGLAFVLLGQRTGLPWLAVADPIAALGVSVIVLWVCWKLGRKSIGDLLDEVPAGLRDRVRSALVLPGVVRVHQVRMRKSGPETFVDLTLEVEAGTSVERGHEVADAAERAVRSVAPGADVVVHVQPGKPPAGRKEDTLPAEVRRIAARLALGAHDVRIEDVMGRRSLEVHIEVSRSLDVGGAHELASAFEAEVRAAEPGLEKVLTHIEPAHESAKERALCALAEDAIRDRVSKIARGMDVRCDPHDIEVHREGGELHLALHCTLAADTGIVAAHDFTEHLELALLGGVPGLHRVVIHVEPPERKEPAPPPASV